MIHRSEPASSRAGRPEPGRGVDVHDRHRTDARRRRVRRPPPGIVATQGDAVAPAVRRERGRLDRRCPAAHRRVVERAVRRRRAHVGRDRACSPGRPARSCESPRGWVEVDRADLAQAAAALADREKITQLTGAEILRHSFGSTRPGCAAASTSVATAGPATSSSVPSRRRPNRTSDRRDSSATCARTRPRRSAGSDSSTPPSSAAASHWTWASGRRPPCWPTWPGRCDGDARRRADTRDRPGRGRRQLGGRVGAVRARVAGPRPPRRAAVVDRRAGRRGRRGRRDHHHLRHGGQGHRCPGRCAVGPARARRGAGDQEPGERDGAAATPHPGPQPPRAHGHADRERPRRPVVDPRLHEPRLVGSRPEFIAQMSGDGEKRRSARSTASSCSAARSSSPRSRPSCRTRSTSSTTAR